MEMFQGFSNKPTWIFADWLKKNPDQQDLWRMKSTGLSREDFIKEFRSNFEEIHNPLIVRGSLYRDLLGYSLELINWDDIANLFKNENSWF